MQECRMLAEHPARFDAEQKLDSIPKKKFERLWVSEPRWERDMLRGLGVALRKKDGPGNRRGRRL